MLEHNFLHFPLQPHIFRTKYTQISSLDTFSPSIVKEMNINRRKFPVAVHDVGGHQQSVSADELPQHIPGR